MHEKKSNYGKIIPTNKKTPKEEDLSDKDKMMAYKTMSHIPKTKKEKKMWIQARRFVAKSSNRYSEKEIPWGLVTKIYKDQLKSGNVMHDKDIEHAKVSKTVRSYKIPDKKSSSKMKELQKMKKKYTN